MHGGGQERGLRSGTLNVPGIVGFGAAAELAAPERDAEGVRVAALRDRLLDGLQAGLDGVQVNGSLTARLPHNLHVSFAGVDGEALITSIVEQVAVSAGRRARRAARSRRTCCRRSASGATPTWGSIRFGLGRTTTEHVDSGGDVRERGGAPPAGAVAAVEGTAGDGPTVDYSAEVLARCRDPRRAGTLPQDDTAVGTGTAGTLDEGTVTRVQVRVGADGVIADARFKVFGCSAAIASASLVADRVVGSDVRRGRAGSTRRRWSRRWPWRTRSGRWRPWR